MKLAFLATTAITVLVIAGNGVGQLFRHEGKNNRIIWRPTPKSTYHVSIQFDDSHICSGTLIGEQHVLTVANCVAHFLNATKLKERVKITIGTVTLPCGSDTFYGLDNVYVHRSYKTGLTQNDIAVIKVSIMRQYSIFDYLMLICVSRTALRRWLAPK